MAEPKSHLHVIDNVSLRGRAKALKSVGYISADVYNTLIGSSSYGYINGDQEIASGKGDEIVDDSTKILLERIDRDVRDHKQEVRDRDARLQMEFQEREKRIYEETKEREERILKALDDVRKGLKDDFKEAKDEAKATKWSVLALAISTILGIAAMVIAVLLEK